MDTITKTAKVSFSSLGIKSPCAGWKKKEEVTFTEEETRMAAQLHSEFLYGMMNVTRSAKDLAIIASLQSKNHNARYGK